MIHAILILDPHNFAIYEFFVSGSDHNTIFKGIEENNSNLTEYSQDQFLFYENPFSDRFRVVICYSEEEMQEEVREALPQLAQNVMKGDKLTLQQLLNASKLSDLSYVR